MSSPPPSPPPPLPPPDIGGSSSDTPNPSSASPPDDTAAHTPHTEQEPASPRIMPLFSFSIMPESASGTRSPPTAPGRTGQNADNAAAQTLAALSSGTDQQQPEPEGSTSFIWTFHVGPEPPAHLPSTENGGNADAHATDNATTTVPPPPREGSRDRSSNLVDEAAPPPPWILPPFFNFFMPIRTEPQPDPRKAAELLRSLPTVGRGLLKRVNRIVAAQDVESGEDEEEKGWKCGVCLEGVESENDISEQKEAKDNGTGVKALPCNHLYHEACLEPWFTTRHTCPACRLDLDPLQTLQSPPETRRNYLRPSATGSDRSPSPHPYARDDGSVPAALGAGNSNAASGPPQPPHRQLNTSHHAHFSFFWTLPPRTSSPAPSSAQPPAEPAPVQTTATTSSTPHPPTPQPSTPQPSTPQPPALASASDSARSPEPPSVAAAHLTAPTTPGPGPMFGSQTHASPMAMDRSLTNAPGTPTQPLSLDILLGTEAPIQQAEDIPAPSVPDAPTEDRPRPERRSHITIFRNSPGPGNPGLGGLPFAPFVLNHPNINPIPFPPPSRTATPTPEAKSERTPFVPKSLECWTEEKEKSMGWRCDAPECLLAPSTDPDEDINMADIETAWEEAGEGGREMINIYSSLQSRQGIPQNPHCIKQAQDKREKGSGAMEVDSDSGSKPFVIVACPHRWHRTCLDTSERSAGRMYKRPDEQGREWVRCEKCRKDGWVVPAARDEEGQPSLAEASSSGQLREDGIAGSLAV